MLLRLVIFILIIYNLYRATYQFYHTYSTVNAIDIIDSLVLAECFAMILSPKLSFQVTGLLIGAVAQMCQFINNRNLA